MKSFKETLNEMAIPSKNVKYDNGKKYKKTLKKLSKNTVNDYADYIEFLIDKKLNNSNTSDKSIDIVIDGENSKNFEMLANEITKDIRTVDPEYYDGEEIAVNAPFLKLIEKELDKRYKKVGWKKVFILILDDQGMEVEIQR